MSHASLQDASISSARECSLLNMFLEKTACSSSVAAMAEGALRREIRIKTLPGSRVHGLKRVQGSLERPFHTAPCLPSSTSLSSNPCCSRVPLKLTVYWLINLRTRSGCKMKAEIDCATSECSLVRAGPCHKPATRLRVV